MRKIESEPDETQMQNFQIIVLGSRMAGKTTLISRYTTGSFTSNSSPTIGMGYRTKDERIDGSMVNLKLLDTGGQERFSSLTRNYYEYAAGAVIVYDCTQENGLKDAKYWLEQAETHTNYGTVTVLVATKCDMTEERKVDPEAGRALAKENGVEFAETSAKTGAGVDALFRYMAESIVKLKSNFHGREREDAVILHRSASSTTLDTDCPCPRQIPGQRRNGCCC